MKKSTLFRILLCLFVVNLLTTTACKKEAEDEQENLNVLKVAVGGATFTWSDTDGVGGIAPKIDTIKLTPNGTFASAITIQDGSANPIVDFTPEIIAEKDDHLFIYKVTTANLTVTDLSKDSKSKDFGQTASFKTGAASNGTLQIILKHLPDKSASDPSKTGESDLDIVFPIVIK